MCEMRIVTIHKYQIKDKNIRRYKALYDELCTPPSKEEKTEKMKKKSNENREISIQRRRRRYPHVAYWVTETFITQIQ
jgi:hypothetical protein